MTIGETIFASLVTSGVTSIVGFLIMTVWYKERKEKKEEKRNVFKQLLSTQAMRDYGKVKALNSIEVVFHDCQDIVQAWRDYKKLLKVGKEQLTQQAIDKISKHEKLLLEKMAKHLGYKNITWDIIEDSYCPEWVSNAEYGNALMPHILSDVAKIVSGGKIKK